MKNNILKFIKNPNFDKNLGKSWYINANTDLQRLLIETDFNSRVTINQTALICSILSPANRWDKNLSDVKNLLKWFFINQLDEAKKPTFFTYGTNVKKAIKFLESFKEFRFLNSSLNLEQSCKRFTLSWIEANMKALKTLNFYYNLANPRFRGDHFTIDRHMLKIAGIEKGSLTKKQYNELKDIYFDVYTQAGFGCLFHEFQAILWANYVFINKGILHY